MAPGNLRSLLPSRLFVVIRKRNYPPLSVTVAAKVHSRNRSNRPRTGCDIRNTRSRPRILRYNRRLHRSHIHRASRPGTRKKPTQHNKQDNPHKISNSPHPQTAPSLLNHRSNPSRHRRRKSGSHLNGLLHRSLRTTLGRTVGAAIVSRTGGAATAAFPSRAASICAKPHSPLIPFRTI